MERAVVDLTGPFPSGTKGDLKIPSPSMHGRRRLEEVRNPRDQGEGDKVGLMGDDSSQGGFLSAQGKTQQAAGTNPVAVKCIYPEAQGS